MLKTLLIGLGLLLSQSVATDKATADTPNVLFFAVDDLRPDLGCYGQQQVHSPHIDQLASQSLLFERAYCQVSVCAPSRESMLTGRRPDTIHTWTLGANEYWRNTVNATSLPQYFKENGYKTIGMGKIFHPGAASGHDDIQYSWSLPYYHSSLGGQYGPGNKTRIWWAFEGFEDNQLPDGQIADNAVKTLQDLHNNKSHGDSQPWFLAVGFHKPHLPHFAPSKYFDMYPPASEIPPASNPQPPKGMPDIAWSTSYYVRSFKDVEPLFKNFSACVSDADYAMSTQCLIPDEKAREIRRAYYAVTSYSDYQVGKVLAELDRQGYWNNTIIVLWGDHGWQLGEHGEWEKYTNFEDGTRVPLILRVPGVTDNGLKTSALVELIDIYPTLIELAGLPQPELCPLNSKNISRCVEGTSAVPLLHNQQQPWKKASFSQFARPDRGLRVIPGREFTGKGKEQVMGYTMRTDEYRYTEWVRFNHTTAEIYWDDVWGRELYDHSQGESGDFNDDNVNLVDDPKREDLVKTLHQALIDGWRKAQPAQ